VGLIQGLEQLISLRLQQLKRHGIHARPGSGIGRIPTARGEPLTPSHLFGMMIPDALLAVDSTV
jgi:hypothetical protein